MKFYDYEQLWILSHGDSKKLVEYFKEPTTGKDFMVNPKALVDAFWLTDRQRAEYIGICALRNYSDYVQLKEVDLNLDYIPPWVPMSVIQQNPLITQSNSKIILPKEKIICH